MNLIDNFLELRTIITKHLSPILKKLDKQAPAVVVTPVFIPKYSYLQCTNLCVLVLSKNMKVPIYLLFYYLDHFLRHYYYLIFRNTWLEKLILFMIFLLIIIFAFVPLRITLNIFLHIHLFWIIIIIFSFLFFNLTNFLRYLIFYRLYIFVYDGTELFTYNNASKIKMFHCILTK